MKITGWPEQERPREKLIAKGAASLSDAELLAIFIQSGVKGKTAVDVARELLNHFDGLRSLLDADQQKLCGFCGLGKAKYAQLQAALEISKRYLFAMLNHLDVISNIDTAKLYLTAKLRNATQEIFACLFLNNQNQVICYEELFYGSINQARVYPREVVKKTLQHNAAAVIFAHNHTSGVAEPSLSDQEITKCLQEALNLVEIRVLDHLIIGEGSIISFAELGFFQNV